MSRRKFDIGSRMIDLKLADAGAKNPPMSAAQATAVLAGSDGDFGTILAKSQEFLGDSGKGKCGDVLCDDWNLFSQMHRTNPKMATSLLLEALQHFMEGPRIVGEKLLAAGIQEYTTKSDFPTEVLDIMEIYHTGIEEIDVGWRTIYDVKDFTMTRKGGFKLRDISSTLSFRKVPTGDKVDIYEMTGSDAEITFDRYGSGLGWDRTWFEDEDYWQATETAIEFRSKYFNDMATVHYALIEAIGAGIDLGWQTASPSALANTDAQYELSRDINTINQACVDIYTNLKAGGMNVTPSTPLVVLAPVALRARINRALGAVYGMASLRTPTRVEYPISVVYTLNLASNTQYYVVLPGKKTKSGIRQNLSVFSDFDILAYADVTAGWGRYGAGIGNTSQFVRCAIS